MARMTQANPQDVVSYVRSMAIELADLCEGAGLSELAQYFERAACAADNTGVATSAAETFARMPAPSDKVC